MFDALLVHMKYIYTLDVNKTTYYLTKVPIIKYFVPDNPYAPDTRKGFIYVMSVLKVLGNIFMANAFQFFFLGYMFTIWDHKGSFALFVFLYSFINGIIKSFTRSTYVTEDANIMYSLRDHLRTNPKQIAESIRWHYFALGFLNRLYLFLLLQNMVLALIALAAWVSGTLLIDTFHLLFINKHKRILLDVSGLDMKNGMIRSFFSLGMYALLVPAYFLLHNLDISANIGIIMVIMVTVISIILDMRISKDFDFRLMLNLNIKTYSIVASTDTNAGTIMRDSNDKKLSRDYDKEVQGVGFVRLNNIFFNRYNKIWRKRRLINISVITVFTLGMLAFNVIANKYNFNVERETSSLMGIVLMGLYYLNFGETITHALFCNCDASLLGYRLFSSKQYVLPNFFQRLKHIVRLHLPQSIVVGVGVVLLVNTLEQDASLGLLVLAFFAMLSASLLFCIHALVTYYLFQPYSIDLEMKNFMYTFVNIVTYVVVFSLDDFGLNTVEFLRAVLISSFVYLPLAAGLVYTLAPTRFKVRK